MWHVIPQMISPVTMAVHIWFGSSMSLSMTARIGSLLGNIRGETHTVMHFWNQGVDLFECLAVLEYFYCMPEIEQGKMIKADPESSSAVKIQNKSFTWGIKTTTPFQEKREKKEKANKEKRKHALKNPGVVTQLWNKATQ